MTHQQAVDKQAVERYLLDEMPEIERFAFEEHLFDCDICADDVRSGALMREGVEAGFLPAAATTVVAPAASGLDAFAAKAAVTGETSPHADVPARAGVGWRSALPWAVAAALAIAAGYQSLWVVPELRARVVGPSVLSPVTLRGASRGTEPTLTRPTTGVISLAVDLTGVAAGARLTYDSAGRRRTVGGVRNGRSPSPRHPAAAADPGVGPGLHRSLRARDRDRGWPGLGLRGLPVHYRK